MGKLTLTHEIYCNAEMFWKTYLDPKFNIALYKGTLGFTNWAVLEQTETDTVVTRKVTATPTMEVPGALQKLVGAGFGYTEEGSMTKAEGIWRWKMTPTTLADKVFTSGIVRVEPIGDSRVRRLAEMRVEAKIFGLGGLIEATIDKQLRDGWDRSAVFMNDYLRRPAG